MRSLVVVAGSLALRVEETRPVLALELLFQVPVEQHLDISAAGAHREDGEVLRGLQPAEHEGTQHGREWAPVADQLSVLQRKRRLVQRAHEGACCVDAALVKWRAQVRADVGGGIDGALKVCRYEDFLSILREAHKLSRCDVGRLQHRHPLLLKLQTRRA